MTGKVFDLQARTFEFSVVLVKFLNAQKRDPIQLPLFTQLIRSGTAIGALYKEADSAESKKDFIHKIKISLKEAKESLYWLNLIKTLPHVNTQEIDWLIRECTELMYILGKISRS